MFDIRSQLMVGCGVTEQVEFAATVEHDQIARHVEGEGRRRGGLPIRKLSCQLG